MDENKIENADLQNGENEGSFENESQNDSGGAEESIETYKQKNQSLYEQLQKAKGKVRGEDGKWIKPDTKTTREEPKAKSDELDYGQKAFLYSHDLKVKGEKETKLVKDIMRETGKNLEQVLDSKYFQAELTEIRELQKTSDATIKGKDSKGVTLDSVEYWATKDFKEVPKDLKAKVIEHKLKTENTKNVFYNS